MAAETYDDGEGYECTDDDLEELIFKELRALGESDLVDVEDESESLEDKGSLNEDSLQHTISEFLNLVQGHYNTAEERLLENDKDLKVFEDSKKDATKLLEEKLSIEMDENFSGDIKSLRMQIMHELEKQETEDTQQDDLKEISPSSCCEIMLAADEPIVIEEIGDIERQAEVKLLQLFAAQAKEAVKMKEAEDRQKMELEAFEDQLMRKRDERKQELDALHKKLQRKQDILQEQLDRDMLAEEERMKAFEFHVKKKLEEMDKNAANEKNRLIELKSEAQRHRNEVLRKAALTIQKTFRRYRVERMYKEQLNQLLRQRKKEKMLEDEEQARVVHLLVSEQNMTKPDALNITKGNAFEHISDFDETETPSTLGVATVKPLLAEQLTEDLGVLDHDVSVLKVDDGFQNLHPGHVVATQLGLGEMQVSHGDLASQNSDAYQENINKLLNGWHPGEKDVLKAFQVFEDLPSQNSEAYQENISKLFNGSHPGEKGVLNVFEAEEKVSEEEVVICKGSASTNFEAFEPMSQAFAESNPAYCLGAVSVNVNRSATAMPQTCVLLPDFETSGNSLDVEVASSANSSKKPLSSKKNEEVYVPAVDQEAAIDKTELMNDKETHGRFFEVLPLVKENRITFLSPFIVDLHGSWKNSKNKHGTAEKASLTKSSHKSRPRPRKAIPSFAMSFLSQEQILAQADSSDMKLIRAIHLKDISGVQLDSLSACPCLRLLLIQNAAQLDLALSGAVHQHMRCLHLESCKVLSVAVDSLSLTELSLRDCGLASVPCLEECQNLASLDLSGNQITKILGLENCSRLQNLQISRNHLISVAGIQHVSCLFRLEVDQNHLPDLAGVETLTLLRYLSARGNGIMEFPSLRDHVLLSELYLDDNSISSLDGISQCWLPLLQVLSLSMNSLQELPVMEHLLALTTLDVAENLFSRVDAFRVLNRSRCLTKLLLNGNPICTDAAYKISISNLLPQLNEIDGDQDNQALRKRTVEERCAYETLCSNQTREWLRVSEELQACKLSLDATPSDNLDSFMKRDLLWNELQTLCVVHMSEQRVAALNSEESVLLSNPSSLAEQVKIFRDEAQGKTWTDSREALREGACLADDKTESSIITKSCATDSGRPSQIVPDKFDVESFSPFMPIVSAGPADRLELHGMIKVSAETGAVEKPSFSSNRPSGSSCSKQSVQSLQKLECHHHMEDCAVSNRGKNVSRRIDRVKDEAPGSCHAKVFEESACNEVSDQLDSLTPSQNSQVPVEGLAHSISVSEPTGNHITATGSTSDSDYDEQVNLSDFEFDDNEFNWRPSSSAQLGSNYSVLGDGFKVSRKNDMSELAKTRAVKQAWDVIQPPAGGNAAMLHPATSARSGFTSRLSMHSSADLSCTEASASPAALTCRSTNRMSKQSQKLTNEWGFHNPTTTALMMKRAKRLKPGRRKNMDPDSRYQLFKKQAEENLTGVTVPARRRHPVDRTDLSPARACDTASISTEDVNKRSLTYSWVCNQAVFHEDGIGAGLHTNAKYEEAAGKTKHIKSYTSEPVLPRLDAAVLAGKFVPLVMSEVHNPKVGRVSSAGKEKTRPRMHGEAKSRSAPSPEKRSHGISIHVPRLPSNY